MIIIKMIMIKMKMIKMMTVMNGIKEETFRTKTGWHTLFRFAGSVALVLCYEAVGISTTASVVEEKALVHSSVVVPDPVLLLAVANRHR